MVSRVKESLIKWQRSLAINELDLTPVEKEQLGEFINLLDSATSEILITEDYGLNMQIVDIVTSMVSREVIREAIRQLRKKVQSRSLKTIKFALIISEMLVKNCGEDVWREVATEKFMKTIARTARMYINDSSRDALEVGEKALDLIQTWGEAFLPKRNELPLFSETYFDLKKEGIVFKKQFDDSRAPVFTPDVTSPKPQARPSKPVDDELLKTSNSCIEMIRDILYKAESRSDIVSNDLMDDVLRELNRLHGNVKGRIEELVLANSEDLGVFLNTNDEIQTILDLYGGVVNNTVKVPLSQGPNQEIKESIEIKTDQQLDFLADLAPSTESASMGKASKTLDPSLGRAPKDSSGGESSSIPILQPPPRSDSSFRRKSRSSTASQDLLTDIGVESQTIGTNSEFIPEPVKKSDILEDLANLSLSSQSPNTDATHLPTATPVLAQSSTNMTGTETSPNLGWSTSSGSQDKLPGASRDMVSQGFAYGTYMAPAAPAPARNDPFKNGGAHGLDTLSYVDSSMHGSKTASSPFDEFNQFSVPLTKAQSNPQGHLYASLPDTRNKNPERPTNLFDDLWSNNMAQQNNEGNSEEKRNSEGNPFA